MATGVKSGGKPGSAPRLTGSDRREGPATATLEQPLGELLSQPLPDNLPAEMFTGPGLLALADLLPVMTAYYDTGVRIQFINKLFADWLDLPRGEIVKRSMAE